MWTCRKGSDFSTGGTRRQNSKITVFFSAVRRHCSCRGNSSRTGWWGKKVVSCPVQLIERATRLIKASLRGKRFCRVFRKFEVFFAFLWKRLLRRLHQGWCSNPVSVVSRDCENLTPLFMGCLSFVGLPPSPIAFYKHFAGTRLYIWEKQCQVKFLF